jgi:ribose-phosphate pyrophosphokinase
MGDAGRKTPERGRRTEDARERTPDGSGTPLTCRADPSHMIVPGPSSQALAAELAAELGVDLAAVDYDRFPDGELLAAVPGFDADRAVVVAATTSSDAHVELLQLQDAVREAGAEEVVTVLPYMGYARQDRPLAPGEDEATSPSGYPLSARAVARAVGTGTDRVLTVDVHEPSVCEFFGVPADSVSAAGVLADPLPDDLADPVFIGPDGGAVEIVADARDAYGRGTVDHFEKTRLSGSDVEVRPSEVAVDGRDVVVVDDIVATGSTMSESVGILRERGAERVFVACVHAVLARDALAKLRRAGVERVVATDTVERPVSEVSAAPVVADELRALGWG